MKKLLVFTLGSLFSIVTFSMNITQVKGKNIIIDLQDESTSIGQKFILVNSKNKKVAVVTVTSIKSGKALAKILSGKATGKETLMRSFVVADPVIAKSKLKNAANSPLKTASKIEPPQPIKIEKNNEKPDLNILDRAAIVLGLSTNSLLAKVTDGSKTETVDMSGNAIGVAGTYDRQMNSWLTMRGLIGYEQFNAIGAATINGCANRTSKDCKTDIKYFTIGGYGRYDKSFSPFILWGALGLNVKVPIAKSSNVIVESSLSSTMSYGVAFGADYLMPDSKMFIPAFIEEQFYLKSDSAEASAFILRVGLGKEY